MIELRPNIYSPSNKCEWAFNSPIEIKSFYLNHKTKPKDTSKTKSFRKVKNKRVAKVYKANVSKKMVGMAILG